MGKPLSARKQVTTYVDDQMLALKRVIGASMSKLVEKVDAHEKAFSGAMESSTLVQRVLSDYISGNEIKMKENEDGTKVVDWSYQQAQCRVLGQDDYLNGKTEENFDEKIKEELAKMVKGRLMERIDDIFKMSSLETFKKVEASGADKLVQYIKEQQSMVEWNDAMEEHIPEVYARYLESILDHKKEVLKISIAAIIQRNGGNAPSSKSYMEDLEKLVLANGKHLWDADTIELVPEMTESIGTEIHDGATAALDKLKEYTDKYPDLESKMAEAAHYLKEKEYMLLNRIGGVLDNEIGKREHEKRISGETLTN